MTTDLIAVTGASGALGRLVVERLLERVPPQRIVAVARHPEKAAGLGVPVRHGDYDHPDTLATAFAGAGRVLLISSPELDTARRVAQHRNAIEAASGTLVYTSFLGADRPGPGVTEAHHATETAIRDSGRPYTLLRNPFYTDAFIHPGLRTAAELTSGTAGRGLNTATRRDLAEAAAAVLTTDGHEGRAYDLTGPLWTFPELAAILRVSYREQPPAGPMSYLHGLAAAGLLERQTDDLETLLGRPPTGIAAAVLPPAGR